MFAITNRFVILSLTIGLASGLLVYLVVTEFNKILFNQVLLNLKQSAQLQILNQLDCRLPCELQQLFWSEGIPGFKVEVQCDAAKGPQFIIYTKISEISQATEQQHPEKKLKLAKNIDFPAKNAKIFSINNGYLCEKLLASQGHQQMFRTQTFREKAVVNGKNIIAEKSTIFCPKGSQAIGFDYGQEQLICKSIK